jgi:hypothetical protein
MPKERLENLARTNFFLAEVRKKLKIKSEVYHKWHMSGCFNGAMLLGETTENHTDFCFSEKEISARDDRIIGKLKNVWFSVHKREYEFSFEEEARKINDEFDKLLKTRGEEILSQVRCFLISAVCWENQADPLKVKEFIDEIIADFPNSKVEKSEFVLPTEVPEHNYDVEVVFDTPLPEDEVLRKMKTYFPNIQKPLFGYGYFGHNPNPELKFFIYALYCRQF